MKFKVGDEVIFNDEVTFTFTIDGYQDINDKESRMRHATPLDKLL
jgi:hypothetical protein